MNTKVMVAEEPGRLALREVALPTIGEDDALLAVEMCGVCGSDPKILRNAGNRWRYPLVLGHEVVGRVERIGPRAAGRWGLAEGDRAVVEYKFDCGHCRMCLQGDYRHCEANLGYGGPIPMSEPPGLWGGYARHLYLAPRARVHKVSSAVAPEVAVLICAIIANGLRWVRTVGGATIGDTVVIQGVGQQGLAAVIAARESGASRIVALGMAHEEERFALAVLLGAHHTIAVDREDAVAVVRDLTGGTMADLVIDVTGSAKAAAASLRLVRKMGTVVNAGATGVTEPAAMDLQQIVLKEITYRGAYTHDSTAVIPAIKLVESGRYPLERLITHRFSLAEARRAIAVVAGEVPEERPVKVVLIPD